MGAYNRARILAAQGKKQEAAQAFADLVSAHPGTAAAKQAQERLSALESEGFKAVITPRPDAG
jgi:TolA-binding protein